MVELVMGGGGARAWRLMHWDWMLLPGRHPRCVCVIITRGPTCWSRAVDFTVQQHDILVFIPWERSLHTTSATTTSLITITPTAATASTVGPSFACKCNNHSVLQERSRHERCSMGAAY
jgi:hypothetical protein